MSRFTVRHFTQEQASHRERYSILLLNLEAVMFYSIQVPYVLNKDFSRNIRYIEKKFIIAEVFRYVTGR